MINFNQLISNTISILLSSLISFLPIAFHQKGQIQDLKNVNSDLKSWVDDIDGNIQQILAHVKACLSTSDIE